MKMPTTPQLVKEFVSNDTIACAEALVEGAKTGQVVGAVIGLLYRHKRYSVAVCGEAFHDPTWARGVIGAVEDELRHLIHERGQSDTTI